MNKFFEILTAVEELEQADQSCQPGEPRYCAATGATGGYSCCAEGATCSMGACTEANADMSMQVIGQMFTLMCSKNNAGTYCGQTMAAVGDSPENCACEPGPTCAPCCTSFLQSAAAN